MRCFVLKRKIDGLFLGNDGNYINIKSGSMVSYAFLYNEKDVKDYGKLWRSFFKFVEVDINKFGYHVLP